MTKISKKKLLFLLRKVGMEKGFHGLMWVLIEDEDLSNFNFSFANLSGSIFRNCILENAIFNFANLKHTRFIGCENKNANFKKAILFKTQFDKIYISGKF